MNKIKNFVVRRIPFSEESRSLSRMSVDFFILIPLIQQVLYTCEGMNRNLNFINGDGYIEMRIHYPVRNNPYDKFAVFINKLREKLSGKNYLITESKYDYPKFIVRFEQISIIAS